MDKSTFLRLWPLAPFSVRNLPFPLRRFFGISIFNSPVKYFVVSESTVFNSEIGAALMIRPPCIPAPGPISTTKSAASIISLSCSTTITEFPASRKRLSELIKRVLSRWCKPIEGSSKTYRTFINSDPIWVAKRIRCASPPDNVFADRCKVR